MPKIPLENIPLFGSMCAQDLIQINRFMKPIKLLDGEILFREGEIGDCFYTITKGEIKIIKALGTPDELLLNTLGRGEVMGEMSLLSSDNRRTASVRAVGETHMLELHRDQFVDLLRTQPSIAYQLMLQLNERLRTHEEATIEDLRKKNEELVKAYRDLKNAQKELIEKEKLDHELDMARDIQMSILPKTFRAPEGCRIGADIVPARVVGGDFYDIIRLDDTRVGIAIGDVSDKGIPAAMFMVQFCTLLNIEAKKNDSPEKVLLNINDHLLEKNDAGLFVTCIYGIYDSALGSFCYARAGHEPPFLVDNKGTAHVLKHKKGVALCLFEKPQLDVNTINIDPGSTLVMFTDGATDAMNSKGELFGSANLKQTILDSIDQSPQDLCENVVSKLLSVQKKQFDDLTLIAFRNEKGFPK